MIIKDKHALHLERSTALSAYYHKHMITPDQVIEILNAAQIKFILVGAHGLASWRQKARATEDVDVIVMARHEKKAVRALMAAFKHLIPEDHEAVIRLRDPATGIVAIDLMKQRALYREAFKHTHLVAQGDQHFRIPSLEMAITMKFAAMISPNRADEDKHIDAHDFIYIVKNNPNADAAKLQELGDVAFPGGGKRLIALVEDVRAGRKVVL